MLFTDTGRAALDVLETRDLDVIVVVSDIEMPEMNGLELLERVPRHRLRQSGLHPTGGGPRRAWLLHQAAGLLGAASDHVHGLSAAGSRDEVRLRFQNRAGRAPPGIQCGVDLLEVQGPDR